VSAPLVDQDADVKPGAQDFSNADTFRFSDGTGELLVHSLLPHKRTITRRGGAGSDFYCPGDEHGGAWGSGENWSLEPAEGAPLPDDPRLLHLWKAFWGDDFSKILRSNRKNVVPGGWRIEVAPSEPAEEDFFLHVLEIGNQGTTGNKRAKLLDGVNFVGAAFEGGPMVLFGSTGTVVSRGEASLPDLSCRSLIITSVQAESVYEISFSGLNISDSPTAALPGVLKDVVRVRANTKGVIRIENQHLSNLRVRLAKI